MSFSWSASSSSSFAGIKPAATNSFADALKRLAEHVEEKNKNIATNNGGTSSLSQLPIDFSNRTIPNSMSPEQTLRLYTQYIHEAERREDMRRCYLRTYGGSDNSNINSPNLNRRLDAIDSYRFMAPHLSSLLHPSPYLQSLTQQTRISLPSPYLFPNIKTTDTIPCIPTQENTDKKSEQSSQFSKSKSKLFRPYDLDSPNSNSHQALPSSPKKSTPSPSTFSTNPSVFPDESQTSASSGKEKQLFNSLGLVQQSTDIVSIERGEDSTSTETDKSLFKTKDSSLSVALKRKSISSSNRKKSKIDTVK